MRAGGGDARPLIVFAHSGANWIRGSEQCLLDLLSGLCRDRFRTLVLCNAPAFAAEVERCGTEVVRVKRWPKTAVGALSLREPILRLLRTRGAALVHANMVRTLPVMYPVVHRLSLPLVSHLHLPYHAYLEYHRDLVERGSAAVGVAKHVVAPLRSSRMPPDRIHVIYNAVNARRLTEGDARGLRAELRIAPTAFVAASVGSLITRKGHDVTLHALARAQTRGLDLHLLLCGSGDEETELRTLAAKLGISSRVHMLGYHSDAGAILRDAADVLVASAREEAFGLNVIEAQWLGVPVIATDVPGHREALCSDAGLLVPREDADALAAALLSLAAAPARRTAMAEVGRACATSRFTVEAYVGTFERLYAELLRQHDRGKGGVVEREWPPTTAAWLRAVLERRARKLRNRWSGSR